MGSGREAREQRKVEWVPLYQQILSEIGREIEVHPNYADLQNHCGLLLTVKGDLKGAERHFLKALGINSKYREAVLNLGHLYIAMERWEKAEAILLTESRKHPKDAFLRNLLANFYLHAGRLKEAAYQFQKALQYQSSYRAHYKKMGIWQGGRVSLSERVERNSRRIAPDYHRAQFHNFIGLFLAKKGKPTQAVRELRKAAELEPNEFLFHANLGTVYYHRGAFQKAVDEYKAALRIDPSYGMGHANLSYVYGLIQQTGKALQHMEKAVRFSPGYADLHYNLALLYGDRRRYEEAVSELKKALRINHNYLFARINLGVLYEDQGKLKEARREYRKVLRITPEDDGLRKRLERIS